MNSLRSPATSGFITRRWPIRVLNSAGRVWMRGRGRRPIDVERILDSARRATGLSNWGSDDFITPLTDLARDFDEQADLSPLGRLSIRKSLQGFVENRLLLERHWSEHPEHLSVPVSRPLYVIGLPRTGTTLLYNLLCLSTEARPLLFWEALHPAPRPSEWRHGGHAARLRQARAAVRGIRWAAPGIDRIHELVADGPEECGWLLNNTFVSQMFSLHGRIPNYLKTHWLRPAEALLPAYEYYRKSLLALQGGAMSRRWVLKSPMHLGPLAALVGAVPEARIVWNHRAPDDVIASCCSLIATSHGLLSESIDLHKIGQEVVEQLAFAVREANAARAVAGGRLFDVTYASLIADPVGVVRSILQHFGEPLTDEHAARMRKWLAEHRQHRHGAHRYSLEQFGLTSNEIRTKFAEEIQWIETSEGKFSSASLISPSAFASRR